MTIDQVKSYFDTKISTLQGAICKVDKNSLIITHPDVLGKFKVYMENGEYVTEYTIRGSVQLCVVHKDFARSFDRCLMEVVDRFEDYQRHLKLIKFADWGIKDNTSFANDLLVYLKELLVVKSVEVGNQGSFMYYVNVSDSPDNILPDVRVYSEGLYSEVHIVSQLNFPSIRRSLGRDSTLTPDKVFSNIVCVLKDMKTYWEQERKDADTQTKIVDQYMTRFKQGPD